MTLTTKARVAIINGGAVAAPPDLIDHSRHGGLEYAVGPPIPYIADVYADPDRDDYYGWFTEHVLALANLPPDRIEPVIEREEWLRKATVTTGM